MTMESFPSLMGSGGDSFLKVLNSCLSLHIWWDAPVSAIQDDDIAFAAAAVAVAVAAVAVSSLASQSK